MKQLLSLKSLLVLLTCLWCALSAGAYDFADHEHGLWFNVIDNGTHASVTRNDYDDGTNYGSYSG